MNVPAFVNRAILFYQDAPYVGIRVTNASARRIPSVAFTHIPGMLDAVNESRYTALDSFWDRYEHPGRHLFENLSRSRRNPIVLMHLAITCPIGLTFAISAALSIGIGTCVKAAYQYHLGQPDRAISTLQSHAFEVYVTLRLLETAASIGAAIVCGRSAIRNAFRSF